MQPNDSLWNLPDIKQVINLCPIIVTPDTLLEEVLPIMGLSGTSKNAVQSEDLAGEAVFTASQPIDCSYVVVVESGRVQGILTERDLVQAVAGNAQQSRVKISELIRQPAITLTLSGTENIFTPLLFFRQYQIRYLPVVDEQEQLLGIVSPASILQALQRTNLFQVGTVGEVTNTQVVCSDSTTSVQRIAQLMAEYQVSCVVITTERANQENEAFSASPSSPPFLPPSYIPVGIVTERKIVQAWALGMDLAQTPASLVMRRLGYELNPANSLLYAYQQMQNDRMETLLVSERQGESLGTRLGIITEIELLRSLEPVQIYRRLKRTQQSVRQLQTEKAQLLFRRNAELQQQVHQQTAELMASAQELRQESEKLRRQVQQARLINKIAQALRGTLVLDEVLQTTADRLHIALNVSRCLIFLPDADNHLAIRHVSQATSEGKSLIGVRCDFSRYYHSQLAEGEPLVLPRIDTCVPSEIQESAKECNISAMIIVPLIYQQSYIGGISLHQCGSEREWTEDEVAFVKAIADHCAIAIHQAELYQQLQTELQERQKAEAALQESNELFHQLADNIQQIFFVSDPLQDKQIYVSPAAKEIWGYEPEYFYQRPRAFLDAVHPEDLDRLIAAIESQVPGQPNSHEYRIIRPDGEIRWVWTRAFPLKNDRGEVYRVTGIVEDITDRKQSEITLKEQQQFLRTIIDTNPNLIFVKDWNGKFTLVNQALADIYGTTIENLIGKSDADFNPDLEQVEQFLAADRDVMTNLQSRLIFEETVSSPTGKFRYFQTIKTPLLSADGVARQVLGVATDISQRKQAQEIIQQSQQMLRLIIDNIPQFVFWKDKNSVYLGCNHNFAQVAGFDNPEQIIGKTDEDLPWRKEESDWFRECDRRVMESNTPEYHIIETQLQAYGKESWVDTNKVPLHNADGNVIGILGTYEDITERKQAEEELRTSQAIFSGIFNNTYQFTALLTPDGNVLQMNKTALDYSNLQAADVVGRRFCETGCWTISKATQERLIEALAKAATGQFVRYEEQVLGEGDATATIDFSLKPVFNQTGEVIQLIAEGRDISDRKQAEAALEKLNAELEIKVQERTQQLQETIEELANEIAERQRTEKALRQSEDRFRNLIETSSDWVWEVNEKAVYTYASPKVREILGYEPEEVLGKTPFDLMLPEEAKRVADTFASISKAKQPFTCLENTNIHKNGNVVVLETSGVPIFDADGIFRGYRGIDRDITDRKRAEETSRDGDRRLRMALNAAQMGTWDWYIEANQIVWPEQTEEIFGFAPGSFPGTYQAYFDRVHPEDRHYLTATITHTLKEKIPYDIEHRIIWPDGSIHWLAGKGDVVCDLTGEPVGISGVVMDITERKQAEAALRDSEFKLRTIFDNSNEAIFIKDKNSRYIFINRAGATFLSLAIEQILGKRDEDLFTKETGERISTIEQMIMASGITWTYEEIVERNGVEHFFLSTKCPYLSPQGELLGVMGICRDITESKQAEKTMRRHLAAVEAAGDGIAIVNAAGEYIYLNESHVKMFGYDSANELMGKSWHELYNPDEIERIEQHIFPFVVQQGNWQGEATAKRLDGTTFPEEISLTFIPDGGLICVCRDITERKRTEERLRLSERAIAASNNGIIISDARLPDRPIIYVNTAFESMTGYSAAEVVGRNCRFLQGSDKNQPGIKKLRAAIRERIDCTVVIRNYRKDGSLFWNELSISPIYDDDGILTHYIGIQTDITERKEAEEVLQATTSRLSALIENLQFAVLVKDELNQVVLCNQAFCNIFNLPILPAALIGADFSDFAENHSQLFAQPEEFTKRHRQLINSKQEMSNEEIKMADGRILEQDYVPIFVQGDYSGHLWMYRDITSRKQAEKELKTSLKEKEVLLKEIHHRVKNNLQVISSLLKLQSAYIKDEEALSLFTESYNRVKSMALIHEKLYQSEGLARINAADYIKELAANLFQSYAVSSTSIKLQIEVEEIKLDIDTAIPCGLIINELFSNSLKYGFVGRKTGEISIKFLQKPQNQLYLVVSDNGVGLPPDFDLEELDSLGLQLVYNLTGQLEGEIEMDSNNGTSFIITFTK